MQSWKTTLLFSAKGICILLLSAALMSCGFNLRQANQPLTVTELRLVTKDYDAFAEKLSEVFRYRGVTLYSEGTDAFLGLVLVQYTEQERFLNDNSVQLWLEVRYLMNDIEQQPIMTVRKLQTDTKVNFDSGQPNSRETAVANAREFLQLDLINRIFTQVQSIPESQLPDSQ